jgi:DNA-binding winged helix-turn-helix (wHTH) protein
MTSFDEEHRSLHAISVARFTPSESKVFAKLLHNQNHIVPHEVLIDLLYAGVPDGGPLTCGKVLQVHICHLRQKMRECGSGWRIDTQFRDGYELITDVTAP